MVEISGHMPLTLIVNNWGDYKYKLNYRTHQSLATQSKFNRSQPLWKLKDPFNSWDTSE